MSKRWDALSDLFSRTVHKGQLGIDGSEAADEVVRPATKKVPEAHVRLVEPTQDETLFDEG